LPGRFPNHGGLTPAALVERAFVHRECRYFSVDRRRAPGAAGVIQPWHTIRSWVVNVITPRKPIAVAAAVTEPRRADARRSCKRVFVYRAGRSFVGKCPHRRTTRSGGRKPPVVREHPRSARNAQCCRCGFRTTAGSRPPLLIGRSSFPKHYSFRSASATRYRTTAG
jgi:hypothetical protein